MKNSGLAVAALVLGIISLIFKFIPFLGWLAVICGVIGLILGLAAKSSIKTSNGQLGGSGMATAGIVLSIITLALWIIGWLACAAILGSI